MRVVLDTNCLVAAALPLHQHHVATIADLGRRRAAGQTFVMVAHVLHEAYSVLTRLPPPHRLAPADALAILERNWSAAETVSLTGIESWRALRQSAAANLTGGRIHDAAIAAAARKAKADELLTWNTRHFEGTAGMRVVTPSTEG